MSKPKKVYVCSECGHKSIRWLGQCPSCGAWDSFVEEVITDTSSNNISAKPQTTAPLSSIKAKALVRTTTGLPEFDRVLGGGLVPGQVILIGGEPGIGKSTLLTQLAKSMLNTPVLYLCGEESPQQVKIRANRMEYDGNNLHLFTSTDVDSLIATLEADSDFGLVIVDSIQTLTSSEAGGMAGSISQLRVCTQKLTRTAKELGIPIIIVGHITKGGELAGPKVLEHIIDTVLYLEGDSQRLFRILRTTKNRFGPISEVGIFEMRDTGLVEVENPSELFLGQSDQVASGSCITAIMEGYRPLLVEIQVLTTRTAFGYPRRTTSGFSVNRLQVLIAILEKRHGLDFSNHDVYLSVVGGLRLKDHAVDLAVCLALVSSMRDKPLKHGTVAFGECGLSGEIRPVVASKSRASEARNLGFSNIISPGKVKSIKDAIRLSF